jgi:hypothetical protein
MPQEAISLALAASIYPPALAAVIALGRGEEVRLRVILFTAAAYLTVLVTGAIILLLFSEAGASTRQVRTPPAAVYVLAGAALLWIAARLRGPRAPRPTAREASSRTERHLESRRLVLALGFVLYVVPSPIFIAALKAIADTHDSSAEQAAYLVLTLVIMLWLIELPTVMLIALPQRSTRILERVNSWIAERWRGLASVAALLVGLYLLAVGVAGLLG